VRRGVQAAVFRLGRVTHFHQTDNSTAATQHMEPGKKRGFNAEYEALMRHLGMEPRTIEPGEARLRRPIMIGFQELGSFLKILRR
jgi:hypothetical protein